MVSIKDFSHPGHFECLVEVSQGVITLLCYKPSGSLHVNVLCVTTMSGKDLRTFAFNPKSFPWAESEAV